MEISPITNLEFRLFKDFIFSNAGISLSDSKQPLVSGRLSKRLKHYKLNNFKAYHSLLVKPENAEEKQLAINLLTTNETYFFREPKHFNFLNDLLNNNQSNNVLRVWSAASSSGEEAYTIAMILAESEHCKSWEVLGSDISTTVLDKARAGSYSIERAKDIPTHLLKKYCLKGIGSASKTMLVDKELRKKVSFSNINLIEPLPNLGEFDIIFLRNVMIYFNVETKRKIVKNIFSKLKVGGYLFISHSESLNGVSDDFELVMPSIYKKV